MAKTKYIPPVTNGDRVELMVETQGSSGDGIARHEGYTLFVPEALPGDRILGEVTKTTPRFGVVRVVERLQLSPDRVEPPCKAFPLCGGCKFQDLRYENQLAFKAGVVRDSLKHIGKIDLPGEIQTIAADQPYHYRNKGSFAVRERAGKIKIGFFARSSHYVVDSDSCDILLSRINETKEWLRGLLQKHRVSIYDETRHKGFLRGMLIRHSETTGEVLLGFITTNGKFPIEFLNEITSAEALDRFQFSGIVQNINVRDTNILLGDKTRVLWGENRLGEYVGDLRFHISLAAFFQVNTSQTLKLYHLIEQWASSDEGAVIDAYCGSGGISLWLGKSGLPVIGIDESKASIDVARESARLNSIESCQFLEGAVERHLADLVQCAPQTLILDPPRKGCSPKVMDAIEEMRPQRVIYISCNPATLGRDLSRMDSYRIADLRVIDMFPQTHHIETAVLLERT